MKVFVAGWFFPPATSSEGIVTYKLLRNSEHEYDVFSSRSKLWGYNASMDVRQDKNIHVHSIDTDDIDVWVKWCIGQFEDRYPDRQYDALMTRSTPPESILVGQAIKEKYPEVKWIASLADPVANNPYELKGYVDDNPFLNESQKEELKKALRDDNEEDLKKWEKRPEEGIRLLCKLKRWENQILEMADLIIGPTDAQLRYMLNGEGWNKKFFSVPHSYDESFYEQNKTLNHRGKTILSFLGYSDKLRSLKPIMLALQLLREGREPALQNLELRIIGNNPRELEDMVLNHYLYDYVKFYPGVDYYRSLELMQESDWLVHVDAYFPSLPTGGSIFFAGKLADYMGAGKPIFAMTGEGSPSYNIISQYGGKCYSCLDIKGIAEGLVSIAAGEKVDINEKYREKYSAKYVAAAFDRKLCSLYSDRHYMLERDWPEAMAPEEEKLLTICVPAYNVEKYLDRCLYTLVNHDMAGYMDIIVVDDGSTDHTAQIGQQFEEHYPGIVRLISKENGGHGSTINKAIEEAKGRYFRTVDGDDWVDSRQLADLLKQIIQNETDVDVISSNYHEVNMETSELRPVEQTVKLNFWDEYSFDQLDVDNIYLTLASMMIRTEILREMKVKLLEHAFYVDVEFILFPVPFIHSIIFTDHFIYKYMRGNGEQSVAIPNMVKRYENHNKVMHRVLAYKDKVIMNQGQLRYYDAILMRLLRTQYALGLIYDEDLVQGCGRAGKFDRYLKRVDPELYIKIGKEMALVIIARKCGFRPSPYAAVTGVFRTNLTGSLSQIGKDKVKGIVYNPLTISIAQSKIMNKGPMKTAKDKINDIFQPS